jgi:hypothetical protein
LFAIYLISQILPYLILIGVGYGALQLKALPKV